MRSKIKLIAIVALALLAGCSKVENGGDNKTENGGDNKTENGDYYVLNNGNYGSNDSNICVYNINTEKLASEAFFNANGKRLGDTGQDILIYGDDIYISVSNSRIIFVTDSKLNIKKEIVCANPSDNAAGAMEPRYLCSYEGKVYVTYYEGYLGRIDPAKGYEVDCTAVGSYPEGLDCCSGKAYVANSGGMNNPDYDKTLSVVDLETFSETEKIQVNTNPEFVKANDQGSLIFVSSKGNYADIPGMLQVVSTSDNSVKDLGFNNLIWMAKGPENRIYLLSGGYDQEWKPLPGKVSTLDASQASSDAREFVADGVDFPMAYSLSVTYDGYVFVGSSDYNNNGDVHVISPEGKYIGKFDSNGLNPIKVVRR